MKFMKLGSRPDTFQTEGNNVRFVASDLASDVVITVEDVKFYLHKFPLLSKSAKLQKLVTSATEANLDEVNVPDIPGGPNAFEICVKFCYGMTVTLNAYNVVTARCAAEYLEMYETVEKGNLIYKIEVFLSSSVFRSWKDSIIVLKTSKTLFPKPDDLKLVTQCIESIASKVAVDTSKVDWSYTYNRKKLPEEDGIIDSTYNGIRTCPVPQDWWVEDLCELDIDLYKRVISCIKSKAISSSEVIGEALKAYVYRWVPGFSKGMIPSSDTGRIQSTIDEIVWLLPAEKGSVSCSFLLNLLKTASFLELGESVKGELVTKIGQQLEEATVNDLLIRAQSGSGTTYDIDIVRKILLEFVLLGKKAESDGVAEFEIQDIRKAGGILSEASKLMVAKLIDGYLTEAAKDPNLQLTKFLGLAEMVSGFNRPSHDGLYRAIDTYLKEHPGITKNERKKICKLMDCKKLSVDASMHAVQNERLPLRVVVQVLFFEQVRAAASSGCSTPDLPKGIKDLANYSHGSSRSATTNNEDTDWDAVATVEELKALKGELAALRIANGSKATNGGEHKVAVDKAAISKMKGLLMSKKVFTRLWSSKGGGEGGGGGNGSVAETSGSDSSESPNPDEGKSTPSRNRRYSVS